MTMESLLYTKNNWQIGLTKNNQFALINDVTGVSDYFIIYDRVTDDNLYYYVVGYDNPFAVPKYIKELINRKAEKLLKYKSIGIKGYPAKSAYIKK